MDRIYIAGSDAPLQPITLGEGERLNLTVVVLPGVSCDIPLEVSIEGSGASADIAGLYLCRSDERVRLSVDLHHDAPMSVSRQVFKGIAAGSSRVDFEGLIRVAPDAQKTEAYQESHSLLESADAVVQASPRLEIYADDVKCSHGATSGFLNPEQLFYLRSRGVPEEEARRLLKLSFLSPVLDRLPSELQQKIYSLI